MKHLPIPLTRLVFDADQLMSEHPPVWHDPNKQAVFAISCPAGSHYGGELAYSRWGAMALPSESILQAPRTFSRRTKASMTTRLCSRLSGQPNGM